MMSVSFQPPANFPLGNEDADLVWAELERARDTLADIQALRLEETGGEGSEFIATSDGSGSEDYMTSTQWLEVHGLKANKLTFQDLVGSLAFRHCNGRVQMPCPSKSCSTGSVEMVGRDSNWYEDKISSLYSFFFADTTEQDSACSVLQGVCSHQVI